MQCNVSAINPTFVNPIMFSFVGVGWSIAVLRLWLAVVLDWIVTKVVLIFCLSQVCKRRLTDIKKTHVTGQGLVFFHSAPSELQLTFQHIFKHEFLLKSWCL